MKMSRILTASIFVMLCCLATSLAGQSGRATITGQVTDIQGAVVDEVEVDVVNIDTGVSYRGKTNGSGIYVVPDLAPGNYRLVVRKDGFRTINKTGLDLHLQDTLEQNFVLAVGSTTESVTINAEAPLLKTETSELGTTMGSLQDLPLNLSTDQGREMDLFALQVTPGVEGNTWTTHIVGTPSFSKVVLIDGTLQQGSETGSVDEDYPPMDAIQEFKVDTGGTVGQESAYTAGGAFMFSMKSGTNKFHGSAFYSHQNEAFNANTWLNDYSCHVNGGSACRKAFDRQHDYIISGGGPIFKDKTFFFGAFEQYRFQNYTEAGTPATLPTPAFLNGDFSALLTTTPVVAGSSTTDACSNQLFVGAIIDPTTGCYFSFNGKLNAIDPSRFSAVSKKIVNIYAQNYQPRNSNLTQNGGVPSVNNPFFHQSQFSIKVDHNILNSDKIASSFIWTERPRMLIDQSGVWDSSTSLTGGPLARSRLQKVTSRSFRLSESHTFSPSLLNVASLTYLRYRNPTVAESASGDWSQQLGLGSTGAGNFPEIHFGSAVGGVAESTIGYSTNGEYVSNIFVGDDSLTWTKGRHTLTLGGEVRGFQINTNNPGGPLIFNFSNDQTGAPTQPWASSVGFGFASFLLGDVQQAQEKTQINLYGRRKELSLFSADTFKASQRLTLVLGLNWGQTYPWKERYGNWGSFNTSKINPTLGIPGVMEYATPGTSFEGPLHWTDFAPRVGASYKLTDRIVARGAYGISYVPIGSNYWAGVPYGFAPQAAATNIVNKTANFTPAFNWDGGYPGVSVPGALDPNYLTWGMVSVSPHSLTPGRVQQFNAGGQIQLAKSTMLSLNYLGTRGSRLHDGELENNSPSTNTYLGLLNSPNFWDWVSDSASATAAGVPYPYAGFSGYAWQTITPFPQVTNTFGPIFYVNSPLGISQYDSFQAEVVQRQSYGLTFDLSWALSHQRTNTDEYNGNFQETWVDHPGIQNISDTSYGANLVRPWNQSIFKGYVVYSLPFGRGRKFLSDSRGLMDAVLRGWTVSTTLYYGSGVPLGYGAGVYNPGSETPIYSTNYYPGWINGSYSPGVVYANLTPGADLSNHFSKGKFNPGNPTAAGAYFSPSAFTNPSYGSLGNAGPYVPSLAGFGSAEEDLSVSKEFAFGERFRMELRGEFFDVFNRHYFADPDTNLASPTFGYVLTTAANRQSGVYARQGQISARISW